MKGTNRQEMYELLCDLQGIQREAYDIGVNFEIGIRETNEDSPWLTVFAYIEPLDPEDEDNHKHFYLYNHDSVCSNRDVVSEALRFVLDHKQKIKSSDDNQ